MMGEMVLVKRREQLRERSFVRAKSHGLCHVTSDSPSCAKRWERLEEKATMQHDGDPEGKDRLPSSGQQRGF